ncbi:MAG: hypothetical protein A4E28_01547 [Methanocella sp. PtaU1.Bin125]|nr:MAG: hypothetical protein A4E28_01547 [Methanocella sp. PtaU1.Bin125]
MLTDIVLKFQIADTGEIFGELMGFTTDMDAFPDDVRLTIGHIEIEVNEVFYDVCTRRQVIDGTITCIDDEDAREVKEEVVAKLTGANYTIYDIGMNEDTDSGDIPRGVR